jgi:hypothetical protein
MVKTFRKKTFRKKSLRKNKKTKRNIKMRGGYNVEDKGTWKQVIFSEEEKEKIKDYLKNNPGCRSIEIREKLFPEMDESLKANANWEIQVVLGRGYAGR